MQQESLFATNKSNDNNSPLANRVRPTTLEGFVGQQHLIGDGKILKEIIDQDKIPSLIFWGPPGVGKTTLAEIIAKKTKANFITFSAVTSGINDIKKVMKEAEMNREMGQKTIVFIDEIHRFNKAQQDAFLPFVEKGSITLIGATTENPSFEINSALLSRCKVFVLKSLTKDDLVDLLKKTLANSKAFPKLEVDIDDDTLELIGNYANGDARVALNTLEMAVINSTVHDKTAKVNLEDIRQLLNTKSLRYDKNGEEHYNIISALHKSMRNSDTDSAIYWVTRMLEGGEDPLYIARRLVRFASEDIGLADTNALNVAINAFQACQFLGMPECNVHLVETVIYLSVAPKSNATYKALLRAQKDVKKYGNLPVPLQVRNAPTKLMKNLGYGKDYQLAHDYADKLTTMKTVPKEVENSTYYRPTEQGKERLFKQRLEYIEQWHQEHDTK
ncbi:recombination factor protein RarA [Companilactobacillus paralimentarius DSM 13238 = JCM 10415]|jgi:ATPase related to the helicase subunit of the Holliday junction resolvase|uniref:Recombination factor protein RarA n=1 Tax=Companilactobacillus paralimentarius DSM 13238 = JCM 10415 TaxID=1122151 RepID=A0A0R1PHU7_9LACO|nr:replication-associated recombination protein A [Companilactobacillus paralimentarius]KAE9564491.1 AAA family ATPase [Companilactobacillus paralimentarius]KRL32000.1 recombination factor protein RarA [Companilactobacillus paralimentarius DSM 13238 = JCM 10415]MDR4932729.1 replication-associated recombination protein A [Companilactobacillus paralimentarius]